MGRNRKKEGEKFNKSINVKVDKLTHEDLIKISESLGLSISDIVRFNLIKKIREVKENGWCPGNFIK